MKRKKGTFTLLLLAVVGLSVTGSFLRSLSITSSFSLYGSVGGTDPPRPSSAAATATATQATGTHNHPQDDKVEYGTLVHHGAVLQTPAKAYNTSSLVGVRRDKAIFCGPQHSSLPVNMIRNEFGFQQIDRTDNDWHVIYGGYPHCGTTDGSPPLDWEMQTGLNQQINQRGWNNLEPHQVWSPCMGCKESYCEKNGLCEILRQVDPSACYKLPRDGERLRAQMDGHRLWVLKRDGKNLQLHAGSGITYVKHVNELPAELLPRGKTDAGQDEEEKEEKDGGYLVQPYEEPFLGQGQYRRKAELRVYLAITSVHPLRLYVYPRMWVVMAGSIYTSSADAKNKCIHDTHAHAKGLCDGGLTVMQRQLAFEEYATKVNMTSVMQENLLKKSKELLAIIIHKGNPKLQKHYVNQGIRDSGASCFSYMRADLGITEQGEPVLFEINQFPYVNEEAPAARQIQVDSHRELFRMMGFDAAPVYGEEERAKYELAHAGQWQVLAPPP